ncbi:peptidase S9 [Flavobacterium branchiophilum]|uniref:Dipeptidyl-peptidase-4 n=1 Tax=Flavobacterium branchiophilum TaxID=55197 RepID=A0A543G5B9_9FLAO|nr:DPP IV N-terminal domain-containing protein [Flavobacterium branchiophilum]OXA78044.1 peptidase S9 [Flavobacterium branchiophilum] [Flavobacterium branchiophilum NBRC 15030 = ATCC 35035]TQM41281.1 dipeptidyl-peptidase-4 [Flavobacterium branchiophilum]
MNLKQFFCIIFLTPIMLLAQKKTISLDEAVMQQNRAFRAEKLAGFQWVPGSNKYVYFTDNYSKMHWAIAGNKTATEWTNVTTINAALGTSLKMLNNLQWVDAQTVLIADNNQYYEYSLQNQTGKKRLELSEKAENATWNIGKSMLAFTENNNVYVMNQANEKISITSENNPAIVSGQSIARNEFGISGGIFWSPKSQYLAFYQKDESQVADYPLLDINETPGQLKSIKYPMAGQASEKPKVGIYHFATQKTVFIAPRGKADDYLTNVSWSPDDKWILIAELNREQNNMNLNLYEAATGRFVRTIVQETRNTWVEPEHEAYFINQDAEHFVWMSEQDGYQNLYYYSINGQLIKQLTQNAFVAKSIVGNNAKGDMIYFYATGPNPTNMLLYSVDLKGHQKLITKDEGQHQVAIADDGHWIFDEYSNHNTPSKSVLYDSKNQATTLLVSPNKYADYVMGSAEIKTIKAADGTTDLYTRLIKPSFFDPEKKYPVLVYVYGGPHAQMITNSYLDGASLWMYWMAEQGYLVFTIDNRGSDNRGLAFESVIHRQLGNNEIADQMQGVTYLKSLPYVDARRLAVHGWSFGGFMTTSLMLKKSGVFNVGVAGGPVTDWKWYEAMYGERYMDTPTENPTGYDQSNTLNAVNNLKGKLLLIHGTSDDVVVMQHNFGLLKKCIEAQKQVDFFAYPMHKHNVMGKDRVHLMTKVLQYVIDHNK